MGLAASVHPIGSTNRCPTCGERFPTDYAVCPRDASPLGLGGEPADPLLGKILAGSYRIIKLLARGGMGRLYEAEHTRLPRRLAVKVIHDAYASHPDAIARFEREARAAALVDSENVVNVVDVVRSDDDRPCIVYERLEGEDLGQRINRDGALPLVDALEIARQMAVGLAAAHGAGIVHRDLKPANIFLAARPGARISVKLLDFGVAKLLGCPEITKAGAVVGTPAYMAPEQARGADGVDGRADLYGLGAVLYKMLSGRGPFDASDATASLTRLLAGPPRHIGGLVEGLPPDVIQIIEDTMAREPLDRPEDATTLAERLEGALDDVLGEGVPAGDPGGYAEGDPGGALGGAPRRPSARNATGRPSEPSRISQTDVAPASSEATAVMPRGAVLSAVRERGTLHRERALGALTGVLVALGIGAVSSGVAAALAGLAGPSTLVAPIGRGVFAAVFAFALVILGRRYSRGFGDAGQLAPQRCRMTAGARVGFGVLGAIAFAFSLVGTVLVGRGPAPTDGLFAVGLVVATAAAVLASVVSTEARNRRT
ncbi:MAG: serine/threonine protein kinase [Deltaproteobacteria bacterium]|nr:serine/threonine protein kinase [Deltaproteobacteria bacterium]